MSTIKADAVTAVSTNGDLSLDGLGTGGVSIASTLKMTKGGDISSASPLVIDVDGNYFDVTGTTNFAAMTVEAGNFFMLQFDSALTITHGSGIELPGAANLTTATGDRLICYATAADTVEVMSVETEAAAASGSDLLIYTDQEAAGAEAGGSYANGAFRTVVLNTEVTDSGGHGALSSNQITLAAGTYDIWVYSVGEGDNYNFNDAAGRFYDTTNTTTLVVGCHLAQVGQSGVAAAAGGPLFVTGRFTLSGSAACELQVYPVAYAWGNGTLTINVGEVNIACLVRLEKVS